MSWHHLCSHTQQRQLNSMSLHSVVTGNYLDIIKLTLITFLLMAGIHNSWQHDSWLKMATKGPYHPYFFSSWGRVWVHHLSLNSGHCWNGDCQWQPLLELQLAVATTSNCHSSGCFFPPLICTQTNKNWVSQWKSAVAFGGTQVVNSNSTLAVQDPLPPVED